MKKEDIYVTIGYNGVYDDKVKRKLKNLIRKYHPDHNGDRKIFEILLKIKREMETKEPLPNKTKENDYSDNSVNSVNDILELEKLYKERELIDKKLDDLYQELSNSFKIYKDYYRKHCDLLNITCNNVDRIRKIKKISKLELLLYTVLILSIILLFYKYSIYTVVLIILLVILSIYTNYKRHKILLIIKKSNKDCDDKNKALGKKISNLKMNIDKNSLKINNMLHDIQKVNDNIRYYKNKR